MTESLYGLKDISKVLIGNVCRHTMLAIIVKYDLPCIKINKRWVLPANKIQEAREKLEKGVNRA